MTLKLNTPHISAFTQSHEWKNQKIFYCTILKINGSQIKMFNLAYDLSQDC